MGGVALVDPTQRRADRHLRLSGFEGDIDDADGGRGRDFSFFATGSGPRGRLRPPGWGFEHELSGWGGHRHLVRRHHISGQQGFEERSRKAAAPDGSAPTTGFCSSRGGETEGLAGDGGTIGWNKAGIGSKGGQRQEESGVARKRRGWHCEVGVHGAQPGWQDQ